MKQKISIAGPRSNHNENRPKSTAFSAPSTQTGLAGEPERAPSDISGVRSSTFQALQERLREAESVPSPPKDELISTYSDGYERKGGQTIFLRSGLHDNNDQEDSSQRVVEATQKHERIEMEWHRILRECSCGRCVFSIKCMLSAALLFLGLFVPIVIVNVFGVNENRKTLHVKNGTSVHSLGSVMEMLNGKTNHWKGRSLWVNHVVVDARNRLLMPETFESRLNAEVAPLLEEHVDVLWDNSEADQLTCQKGEHPFVAFSIVKSAAVPASITYERPCESNQAKLCSQQKHVRDIRDLVITLPFKSSKHTYSVKVAEHRLGSRSPSGVPNPARIEPFGSISGPFQVELSDGSKLALQRYCGMHRKNFAEDLDSELVTKDNTRLLTIYELRRLFSIWSKGSAHFEGGQRESWDSLLLTRAVIDPIDHSRHPINIHEVVRLLSSIHVNPIADPSREKNNGNEMITAGTKEHVDEVKQHSGSPVLLPDSAPPKKITGNFISTKDGDKADEAPASGTSNHVVKSSEGRNEQGLEVKASGQATSTSQQIEKELEQPVQPEGEGGEEGGFDQNDVVEEPEHVAEDRSTSRHDMLKEQAMSPPSFSWTQGTSASAMNTQMRTGSTGKETDLPARNPSGVFNIGNGKNNGWKDVDRFAQRNDGAVLPITVNAEAQRTARMPHPPMSAQWQVSKQSGGTVSVGSTGSKGLSSGTHIDATTIRMQNNEVVRMDHTGGSIARDLRRRKVGPMLSKYGRIERRVGFSK